MSNESVINLVEWVQKQAAAIPYGEIRLTLITHAGKIQRIEKGTVIKQLTEGGGV